MMTESVNHFTDSVHSINTRSARGVIERAQLAVSESVSLSISPFFWNYF